MMLKSEAKFIQSFFHSEDLYSTSSRNLFSLKCLKHSFKRIFLVACQRCCICSLLKCLQNIIQSFIEKHKSTTFRQGTSNYSLKSSIFNERMLWIQYKEYTIPDAIQTLYSVHMHAKKCTYIYSFSPLKPEASKSIL